MSEEFELLKRSINVQIDEYERDIAAYAKWYDDWQIRQMERAVKRRTVSRETLDGAA